MKTVNEVSKLTGVSVRTLHYYDSVGLLRPTKLSDAGYRLYDDDAVSRLYMIVIYRELGFSVKEIGEIMDAPDFDRNNALEHQISLLEERKKHLQNRIYLARGIRMTGVKHMDFKDFDRDSIDEYSAQAKVLWGNTDAYKEFEEKNKNRNAEDTGAAANELMELFRELGTMRQLSPESDEVQHWVSTLRNFISENFYTCTIQILGCLGKMYSGGGSMTENIDSVGGLGTGEFADMAIEFYCRNN